MSKSDTWPLNVVIVSRDELSGERVQKAYSVPEKMTVRQLVTRYIGKYNLWDYIEIRLAEPIEVEHE